MRFSVVQNRRDKNGVPCTIDEYNQLTSDSIDSFTYDQNGRRTSKNNSQYTYDALGRLTTFNDGSQRIDYRYDPFGRRIERQDSDATVQYLYQFDTEIGAYENDSLREFRAIHGQFAPFAIELEGKVYSPIRNHRGDICVLLDNQRTPVSTYRYDAFGEFSSHGIDSPWLFSGQRYDDETHLYHFAKREYDPVQGRWLTPDPLGFVDGPNLYAYVGNNPLIYVDPFGLYGAPFFMGREQTRGEKLFISGLGNLLTLGLMGKYFGKDQFPSPQSTWEYLPYGAGTVMGIAGIACSAFKGIREAASLARAGKHLNETSKVVKLTQESKPLFQRFGPSLKNGRILEQRAVNINAKDALGTKLLQLESAQRSAAKTRLLPDGRVRYYRPERLAGSPGPTRGSSYVTEFDPKTGRVRGWNECYDHSGNVNRVHPKNLNGQELQETRILIPGTLSFHFG